MTLEIGDIIWNGSKTALYEVNRIPKPNVYELGKLYDETGDYSTLKYICQWTPEECMNLKVILTPEARLWRTLFR